MLCLSFTAVQLHTGIFWSGYCYLGGATRLCITNIEPVEDNQIAISRHCCGFRFKSKVCEAIQIGLSTFILRARSERKIVVAYSLV